MVNGKVGKIRRIYLSGAAFFISRISHERKMKRKVVFIYKLILKAGCGKTSNLPNMLVNQNIQSL